MIIFVIILNTSVNNGAKIVFFFHMHNLSIV